jgi:hypothetical protein
VSERQLLVDLGLGRQLRRLKEGDGLARAEPEFPLRIGNELDAATASFLAIEDANRRGVGETRLLQEGKGDTEGGALFAPGRAF